MAQKRKEESEFKVSDKRLFTADGELRSDSVEEEQAAPPAPPRPQPRLRRHSRARFNDRGGRAHSRAAHSPNRISRNLPPPPSSRRSTMPTSSRRAIWIRESN